MYVDLRAEGHSTGLPPQLLAIARERDRPLPLIGAGLGVDAGVPAAWRFGHMLAAEAGLPFDDGEDLESVVARLVERDGAQAPDRIARIVLARLPILPTRTLAVIGSGCAGRHILTTNYEDAIERSVELAGLTAVSYDIHDARCLATPAPGEVAVVHLHGWVGSKRPLIFPGPEMDALRSDEGFQRNASALLARATVLYLGFRFAESETHLQRTVQVLSQAIDHAGRHVLMLEAGEAERRPDHLDALKSTGLVEVVFYDDPHHRVVHQAALLFAPQAASLTQEMRTVVGEAPHAYLVPLLLEAALETKAEELDRRAMSVDHDWGEQALTFEALAESPRTLLLGAPGMGKTELLRALARTGDLATVVVDCRVLATALGRGASVERAVASALAVGEAGTDKTQTPTLDVIDEATYRFAWDALDELGPADRVRVVEALATAARRWPHHRWIVASRPNAECVPLTRIDFAPTWLWPSASWAEAYLERRGVPADRVEALNRSSGLEDLIAIPLYAAAAADRLLDPTTTLPARPLDLLVDLQRGSSGREARLRGGMGDTTFDQLQALAVGLTLRGRTEATTTELAEIAGAEVADAEIMRESLIQATLLAPSNEGRVAFVRRTTQEALCADALLAHPEVDVLLRDVAMGRIAGQDTLRDDIGYVLDLVFENADAAQRVALRHLDAIRWARTVLSRGQEVEAGEALDVLLDWHRERGVFVSPWADEQVRSVQGAVWAIGRRWSQVVDARRTALIEDIAHGGTAARHNAMLAYAAAHDEHQDPAWLLDRIDDPETAVEALRIARSWRDRRLWEPLLSRLRAGAFEGAAAAMTALALGDIANDTAERIAIGRAADRIPGALRHVLPALISALPRPALVNELRSWPSDSHLWDFALETAVSASAEPWSAVEVTSLVRVLVDRIYSTADIERRPDVLRLLREHATTVIDALRSVAETHLALTSVRVLLGALDPRDWSGELAGPLGRYLSEPAPEDSTSLPRSSLTFEQQIVADLDAGRIDETRPDVLDMRPDAVPERLRPRLRELSAAWWPKEPLVEISRFSESGHSAAAAITAAAIGGVELTRERWLELVLAPDHFDFANHVWRWLTDAYDPAWEPEVISVVATADTHALTSVLATAQTPSERLTEAVGARLAQLPSDGWWSNTVGLLRDRGEEAILVGLATASLDPARQAHVDEKLAELGNADAQVRILDRRLAAASRGDAVDTFHWRDPIPDERVIGRLGELLRVLPRTAGTRAGDVRSTVAGALSASRSAAAIDLFDAIAARDDGDQLLATFGAQTVRARLATEAVLSRLPESPALTARLVMHRTRAVHPRKSMRIQ